MSRHAPSVRLSQRALLSTTLIVLTAVGGNAQDGQRLTLSVNDPRPLAEAIRTLEKRHGWIITYEDPPYLHPGDFVDVTAAVRKDYTPDKPRILGPRGGTFDFGYTISSGGDASEGSAILRQLLDEYNQSGPTGKFRLVETGHMFHVVPSHFRAATGTIEAGGSLLDVKISLPVQERSADAMLEAIVAAIPAPAQTKIQVGMFPVNLFIRARLRDGADRESARDVLVRTLQATNHKLSWKLLCSPGAVRNCYLSILGVPTDAQLSRQ